MTEYLKKFFSLVIGLSVAISVLLIFKYCTQSEQRFESKILHIAPHFFESESDYYREDEFAGHFHRSDVDLEHRFTEHPLKKIDFVTNNLGFRKDGDTPIDKPRGSVRVLVTGDSHTDGVVYNSESFPNLIEEACSGADHRSVHEVLNAGVGYFGPQNYLGVLKAFHYLKPDVFVVTLYTGNDFLEAIRIECESGRMVAPVRGDDYYGKLVAVDENFPGGFTGQIMNQALFFKSFPNYVDLALNITDETIAEIKHICDQSDVRLTIVLLPTKVDVEIDSDRDRLDGVVDILGFSEVDLGLHAAMSTELSSRLRARGIEVIDLMDFWNERKGPELFWKKDYHLNRAGHASVAEILVGEMRLCDRGE